MPHEGVTDTRERVIDAAVQSILEVGIYRASTNAIAERAGLSWGVIQYYFGSRESLMLAVLEDGTHRLVEIMQGAELTADTTLGRVDQCFDLLGPYHESPAHVAYAQVRLNLSHDPNTSAETRERLVLLGNLTNPQMDRLGRQILRGGSVRRQELRDLVFYAIRGLALGHLISPTLPANDAQLEMAASNRRSHLMARAIALLIDEERERRR